LAGLLDALHHHDTCPFQRADASDICTSLFMPGPAPSSTVSFASVLSRHQRRRRRFGGHVEHMGVPSSLLPRGPILLVGRDAWFHALARVLGPSRAPAAPHEAELARRPVPAASCQPAARRARAASGGRRWVRVRRQDGRCRRLRLLGGLATQARPGQAPATRSRYSPSALLHRLGLCHILHIGHITSTPTAWVLKLSGSLRPRP